MSKHKDKADVRVFRIRMWPEVLQAMHSYREENPELALPDPVVLNALVRVGAREVLDRRELGDKLDLHLGDDRRGRSGEGD